MAKEKVTLTIDSELMRELRQLAGSRSVSASVETAIEAHVQRLRHLAAVDDWLAELEHTHGPAPVETLEWAARVVDEWDKERRRTRRKAG